MHVTKYMCPARRLKNQNLVVALKNYIKNKFQQTFLLFFTYFHEFVRNIFSEILNRPFANFKIIFNIKNIFKVANALLKNFFHSFCMVFEKV